MNGKAIRVKFVKNGKNRNVIRKVITEQTIVAAYKAKLDRYVEAYGELDGESEVAI